MPVKNGREETPEVEAAIKTEAAAEVINAATTAVVTDVVAVDAETITVVAETVGN